MVVVAPSCGQGIIYGLLLQTTVQYASHQRLPAELKHSN